MPYDNIQPPFTLKFWDMSKSELREYFKWFMNVLPSRIAELARAVTETPGLEHWKPDNTPESLSTLGEWFATQVDTRKRTSEELADLQSSSPFPIEFSDRQLTIRTFSLAVDIGMYFSQVMLANHPSLHWNQPSGSKNFVDYGQPVLVWFGPVELNPIQIMITLAYGLSDGTYGGGRLRALYDIWSKKVGPKPKRETRKRTGSNQHPPSAS